MKETLDKQAKYVKQPENGTKNYKSVQLRSARNLPEIKSNALNQKMVKINKIDELQQQSESPLKTSRPLHPKKIITSKPEKLSNHTTPVTPAG